MSINIMSLMVWSAFSMPNTVKKSKSFCLFVTKKIVGKGFIEVIHWLDTLNWSINVKSTLLKEKEDKWLLIKKTRQLKNRKVSSFRPPTLYGKRIKISVLKQKKFLFFYFIFFLCICFDFTIQFYSPFVIHSFVGWLVGW